MSARQLLLDLPAEARYGRADFLPAPCNGEALALIDAWEGWPGGRLVLTGPPGSGRTHLARLWAAEAGALCLRAHEVAAEAAAIIAGHRGLALDDADALAGDPAAEEALFHCVNALAASGRPLLLTATDAPGTWGLDLPDLESRLQASLQARLGAPDTALLAAVLVKLCGDRQLAIGPDTVAFLARRQDRSLAAAERIVAALDARAVAAGRRVSRRMAADLLRGAEA